LGGRKFFMPQQKGKGPVVLAVLNCHTDNCCPELCLDAKAAPGKQVILSDDFGGRARISRAQLADLVRRAKRGEFDKIG